MARYLVTTKITGATDAGGNTVEYRKGTVVELTAAQVSALGRGATSGWRTVPAGR